MSDQEYNYKNYIDLVYPRVMANDGISDNTILLAEQRLGLKIPKALRSFYALVGNRKDITESYNRLLAVDKISVKDDILVFLEENQAVVIWGIRVNDLSLDDPAVFVAENNPKRIWKSTGDKLFIFLGSMLYWQAVNGGLSYIGVASRIGRNIKPQLKQWTKIKIGSYFHDMEMFALSGKVVCVVEENDSFDLYAGGRSRDDFVAVDQLIGIKWDYSTLYDES
jgi:hypothetical protein